MSSARTRCRCILGKTPAFGFTLVEIMIAMVIGLFLILGASNIFVISRQSSNVDESIARLHETARYAISVIASDVLMANYWGLSKDGAAINSGTALVAGTNALACGPKYAIDFDRFIDASNNTYALPTATCGPYNSSAVASADTLTVRRAEISRASPVASNKLQLCSARSGAQVIRGSDCARPAEVHDLIVNAYYVGSQSSAGRTIPSLRRKVLGVASDGNGPGFKDEEVITGVEDMQVQLGWDASASASAMRYVNPGNEALATGQVVAVRIWLLVRTEIAEGAFQDSRIYSYGDRSAVNGTVSSLNAADAAGKAYAPRDGFRRLLIERTFFIRNAIGT